MKQNYLFLMLTIIVSALIWLQINLSREQQTVLHIPIKITNLPENLYLFPQMDIVVPVRVVGKGLNILFYYLSERLLYYNGKDITIGENTLDVSKIEYTIPKNNKLTLSPFQSEDDVLFTADVIVQKPVPVIYDFFGPNDKIALQNNSYVFDDDLTVTISGPGQLVQDVTAIFTDKIGAEILKSKSQMVRLISPSEHIMVTPQSIELRLVTQTLTSKTITFIPIKYNSSKYTIFPERVSVKLEGTIEALNAITVSDIIASIDDVEYSDLATARIDITMPETVRLLDFTPKSVTVRRP